MNYVHRENREELLERIKRVMRKDPTLSRVQLLERFHHAKSLIPVARRQLQEEGVVFPDPRSAKAITCYQ